MGEHAFSLTGFVCKEAHVTSVISLRRSTSMLFTLSVILDYSCADPEDFLRVGSSFGPGGCDKVLLFKNPCLGKSRGSEYM